MPPRDSKTSSALTSLRRSTPMGALVRVGYGTSMTKHMTKTILRNIHLSILSRKEENLKINETENNYAPVQRDGEEPVLKWVRVAVKPDPVGSNGGDDGFIAGMGGASGLSGQGRKGVRSQTPAFVLTEVPYDEWRKHYAKDRFGKYRGLEAPAQNCILIAEDEAKWRPAASDAKAIGWTEGVEASQPIEPLKRSVTSPEMSEVGSAIPLQAKVDPTDPTQDEEGSLAGKLQHSVTLPDLGDADSEVPTQDEEAIFIAADGHTASQIVHEPKVELTSPTSSKKPTWARPPMIVGPRFHAVHLLSLGRVL